jgi:hypothetical protein
MILGSFKKILAKAGVLLTSFLPSAKADGNKACFEYFSVLARVDISAIIIGIES